MLSEDDTRPKRCDRDEAGSRWIRAATLGSLAGLLLAMTALPWAYRFVPGQDGPTHLAIARIFVDLIRHNGGLDAQFYEFRPDFFTNFGTEAIGAALLPFLGPIGAEKLLFTLVLVGIPLAIIACMVAASRKITPFMLLALPYGYGTTLASGNFNFLIGLTLGLLLFSFVLGRSRPPSVWSVVGLAVGWLAVVLIHPAATVVAMWFTGGLVVFRAIRLSYATRHGAVRLLLAHLLTVLPAITVLVIFLLHSPSGEMEYQRGVYLRVRELLLQYDLYKLDRIEIVLSLVFSVALVGLLLPALGRRRPWRIRDRDVLLGLAASGVALYFLAPNKMSGGDAIVSRLQFLPWTFVLIWLSVQRFPRLMQVAVLVFGVLLQGAYLTAAYRAHAIASADMTRYWDLAAAIPPNAIVLPVIGETGIQNASGRIQQMKNTPFQHLHNAVAVQKHAVFLDNWNAHFRVANVRFRPDRDPYPELWSGDLAGGLERYESRTGVRPDYVLVWRMPADGEGWESLKTRLDTDYHPVATLPGPLVSAVLRRVAP